MSCNKVFLFSFCILFLIAGTAQSQKFPTVLTCTSNAKASRDYNLHESEKIGVKKGWTGQQGHLLSADPSPFDITTKDKYVEGVYLRDKVFSGLNTTKPIIRSITRYKHEVVGEWERAEEFAGHVVGRTFDTVILLWASDFSYPHVVWTAIVNLTERKVALTRVFQDAGSVGGELETLDCR